MHDAFIVRVFSARDYEGHCNDAAVLYLTSPEQKEASVGMGHQTLNEESLECINEQGLFSFNGLVGPFGSGKEPLCVRPQVMRSVTKRYREQKVCHPDACPSRVLVLAWRESQLP